jgi:hypothetical protein
MSPIGGLGINVAIQDAVAAANLLWKALSEGRVDDVDLARVQREREFPVKVLQGFQTFVQNRFLKPTLDQTRPPTIPLGARVLARVPFLRDLPARFVGLGIRRPHVESPERQAYTSAHVSGLFSRGMGCAAAAALLVVQGTARSSRRRRHKRPAPACTGAARFDGLLGVGRHRRLAMATVTPPKGDYISIPLSDEGRRVAFQWDPATDGS